MQYTQWVITPQITWMSIKSFVLLSLNDLCSIIHSSASGESKADGSTNNLGTKMHKEIVTAENSPSVGVARNFQKVGADLKNKNQMLSASLQLNSLKLKIFLWHVTQGNIPKFQSTICISANLAENSIVKYTVMTIWTVIGAYVEYKAGHLDWKSDHILIHRHNTMCTWMTNNLKVKPMLGRVERFEVWILICDESVDLNQNITAGIISQNSHWILEHFCSTRVKIQTSTWE